VVDQPMVSGRHCKLTRTDEGFVLQQLRSRSGTFVNGVRIDGPIKVTGADTIRAGGPYRWRARFWGRTLAEAD